MPKGEVPYEPSEEYNHPSNLPRENTKYRYFAKEGPQAEQLPSFKRARLFLGMLEGVHPKDALVLIDMINKTPPKYITRPIVEEAFPGLLKD